MANIDEEKRVIELDEDDAVILAKATPKIARLIVACSVVLSEPFQHPCDDFGNEDDVVIDDDDIQELKAAYEALYPEIDFSDA